jgi:hypothetical protein
MAGSQNIIGIAVISFAALTSERRQSSLDRLGSASLAER